MSQYDIMSQSPAGSQLDFDAEGKVINCDGTSLSQSPAGSQLDFDTT